MFKTSHRKWLAFAAASFILSSCGGHKQQVERLTFAQGTDSLFVEVLDDDLLHVQYKSAGADKGISTLSASDIVAKRDYKGPSEFTKTENTFETKELKIEIDPKTLAVKIIDKTKNNAELTTFSPLNISSDSLRGFSATKKSDDFRAYGLGQQFSNEGSVEFSYNGRKRESGKFGNEMIGFNWGANGNTQIPVLYAQNGATYENYALYLDNKYKHAWDFTSEKEWNVQMHGGDVRFYVMTGENLHDLRKDYMELTGNTLIPPKKMFGLWVSEYGYDDWKELEDKLSTLRKNNFPIDGFVLDLQWFGGIVMWNDSTKMGRLAWDTDKFPNPKKKLDSLEAKDGVGVMNIEEVYVGARLPEYEEYKKAGIMVLDSAKADTRIFKREWWGAGGMIDYTNPKAGAYIHEKKRLAFVNDGVLGHWTDLGEPENYNAKANYAMGSHKDINNIWNFYWIKSIYDGYAAAKTQQRPFIMSRSGSAGIQRFGAAMWSGDIASRLTSLAAHASNQANMSFSGIDYYGADLGGFHRNLEGDVTLENNKNMAVAGGPNKNPKAAAILKDLYTRWYAYGMLFDIPGRPHVANVDPKEPKETAPDRIGDVKSNLANTRQRYELVPYSYSLAYRAHKFAEPVVPPLVYYYQTDKNVTKLGDHKLIGKDLLGVMTTEYKVTSKNVYLPAGTWYDWYTNEKMESKGQTYQNVPLMRDSLFRLPLYAREGAIIPMAVVTEATINVFGRTKDGKINNDLAVKVFASDKATDFSLYEDDGKTIDYQSGKSRLTKISQQKAGNAITVTIAAAEGSYQADEVRNNIVTVIAGSEAKTVNAGGKDLAKVASLADLANATEGWATDGKVIVVKTGAKKVTEAKAVKISL